MLLRTEFISIRINFCNTLRFSKRNTNVSVDSLQLTTTCCNGRWRPSERWARGAQTEHVRAVTSATERVRAVWLDAHAELLSEHEFVAASRGVLFVTPGGRAAYCARYVSRDCWPVHHLVSVYARSDSRATLWPSNHSNAHSRRTFCVPTATGKPRAPRNRSIDSLRGAQDKHAGRVPRQWRNFTAPGRGNHPKRRSCTWSVIRSDLYNRGIWPDFQIAASRAKRTRFSNEETQLRATLPTRVP